MSWNRYTTAITIAAVAALASGCAASAPSPLPGGRGVLAADRTDSSTVPRVRITAEVIDRYWVLPTVELDDDAYALLIDVAPDGRVSIVEPATQAPVRLKGGVVHKFGKVNPSWVAPVFARGQVELVVPGHLETGRRETARGLSSIQDVGSGPGYFFALVSRAPFRLSALDSAGLFSAQYVGSTLAELEPEALIPLIAELARGADSVAVRSNVARYAGYVTNADARRGISRPAGR